MRDPLQPTEESRQVIHQDNVLALTYRTLHLPNGSQVKRTVVELPARVLIVPVGHDQHIVSIGEYNAGAGRWQLTLPGGKVEHQEDLGVRAQLELRQETGFRGGQLTRLQSWCSHPGAVSQDVHVFVASDLAWDPLAGDEHEQIQIYSGPLEAMLITTQIDYRWDPEAAFALWLYASLQGDLHRVCGSSPQPLHRTCHTWHERVRLFHEKEG